VELHVNMTAHFSSSMEYSVCGLEFHKATTLVVIVVTARACAGHGFVQDCCTAESA